MQWLYVLFLLLPIYIELCNNDTYDGSDVDVDVVVAVDNGLYRNDTLAKCSEMLIHVRQQQRSPAI